MESPCHHCTKRPCYDHDTCKEYQDFREATRAANKKREEFHAAVDATCIAVRRCKRKR